MSKERNIRCTFSFGHRGKFAVNLELNDRDLFELQQNRIKGHSVEDFIKQLAIEYIIGLRPTIEQTNPDFNYDNLVYVNIDGQKVDAKEIHQIMKQKMGHLIRHMGKKS
jgi:hypothetical protein